MEFYKRELLVYRISCGYQRFYLESTNAIFIYQPTQDIKYAAQEKYIEAYELAKDCDIPTPDEIVQILRDKGLWSDDKDTLTDKLIPETIENLKVDIYKANIEIKRRELLRAELRIAEEKLNVLYAAKHAFDIYSCVGIAAMTKLEYIVRNCSKYENGENCDWDIINPKMVMSFVNNNIIDEKDYRELAKKEPWRSIWSASKRNDRVFDKIGANLSDEQCKLISYSHFYDQINEHPDCPHESIVSDDDMLDGWLILQKREKEKDQNIKRFEDKIKNPKIANSQEIFIVAHNEEEIEAINSLNSSTGKMIKNSRLNKIKQQGESVDADFADVQRDIMVKMNAMQRK